MRLLEDEPRVWSFPACEPGRSKYCEPQVVKWWKRVGSPTKLLTSPPDLKLAILTRARIRLPFRSIKWLLALGRATRNPHMFWARRLPPNYELVTILAEVDVTVELFWVRDTLHQANVNFILGRYLKQRHATEIPNCASRFLFTWDRITAKADIEDKLSQGCPARVSLDRLISESGLRPRPGGLTPKEAKGFVLLVYASFPNDIDLHLAPPPSTGGTPEERVWGLLHRVHEEMAPVDEEDDEVICLVDRLLDGAKDAFTSRLVAQDYADARLKSFLSKMRASLANEIEDWKRTDVDKFITLLRDYNKMAQAGLMKIQQLYGHEYYTGHPRVRRMWAWRNKALHDSKSIMNCYVSKLR